MKTSVIGYPRIGKDRELKFASEKFFSGSSHQRSSSAESLMKQDFLRSRKRSGKKIFLLRKMQGSHISLPMIFLSTTTFWILHSCLT